MTPAEIQALFSQPGIYVLEDGRCPGATCPVAVLSDSFEANGQPSFRLRAFMLSPTCELSADPAAWGANGTTSLVGGPFSVQVCDMLDKDGQRLHDLESAVAEAKEYARLYRDLMLRNGCQHVAQAMQIMLDTLTLEPTP